MPDDIAVRGVVFPQHEGRRSTSALGRRVVAAALEGVDDVGARAAARSTSWRSEYLVHFRRLVEAGLPAAADWVRIAQQGLDGVHADMRLVTSEGGAPLRDGLGDGPGEPVTTARVDGTATARGLAVPIDGDEVAGDALRRRAAAWIDDGIAEPSVAPAIDDLVANPDWLPLAGRTVVVCGAGSEMGPVACLLGWGATVAAIDLPGADRWRRLLTLARRSAGTLLVPVHPDRGQAPRDHGDDDGLAVSAGLDLLTEPAATADWIAGLPGALVVANTAYADGGLHVRLSAAIDAITLSVLDRREDVTLAFLATPTDVFVVPHDAVVQATEAYEGRSRTARLLARPLRTLTRGRLLARNHPPDADPGIADALVPAQGPNYALAKRIQRWRATVAAADGVAVSLRVAPSTRTTSVMKNRVLAAAYAGAHRFGVEVFEPDTSNRLMAALLVADLQRGQPTFDHPWQVEAHEAVHGGLWRMPYAPRSALGLAAALGYASSRT